MTLDHLHLHVADATVSAAWYGRWFGFAEHAAFGDGSLALRDDAGFLLVLLERELERDAASLPGWLHVGFSRPSADDVRRLRQDMAGDGVRVDELVEEDDYVSFRSPDPDGLTVEVFWEPAAGV